MNRRALTLKLACLLSPLAAGVVTLHVWGESLTQGVERLLAGSKYDSFNHDAFLIRATRGSSVHLKAGETLETFTQAMVDTYGPALGFRKPDPQTSRITVYLVDSHKELKGFGLSDALADLSRNGGFFAPAKLEIVLEIADASRDLAETDRRGLQHEMTHALMHLAHPRAQWSPWLSEGMAGYFENSRPSGQPRRLGGVVPEETYLLRRSLDEDSFIPVRALVTAQGRDFMGPQNLAYYREACLLTAFLLNSEEYRPRFFRYYEQESLEGEVTADAFSRLVGSFETVERDWVDWVRKTR